MCASTLQLDAELTNISAPIRDVPQILAEDGLGSKTGNRSGTCVMSASGEDTEYRTHPLKRKCPASLGPSPPSGRKLVAPGASLGKDVESGKQSPRERAREATRFSQRRKRQSSVRVAYRLPPSLGDVNRCARLKSSSGSSCCGCPRIPLSVTTGESLVYKHLYCRFRSTPVLPQFSGSRSRISTRPVTRLFEDLDRGEPVNLQFAGIRRN